MSSKGVKIICRKGTWHRSDGKADPRYRTLATYVKDSRALGGWRMSDLARARGAREHDIDTEAVIPACPCGWPTPSDIDHEALYAALEANADGGVVDIHFLPAGDGKLRLGLGADALATQRHILAPSSRFDPDNFEIGSTIESLAVVCDRGRWHANHGARVLAVFQVDDALAQTEPFSEPNYSNSRGITGQPGRSDMPISDLSSYGSLELAMIQIDACPCGNRPPAMRRESLSKALMLLHATSDDHGNLPYALSIETIEAAVRLAEGKR